MQELCCWFILRICQYRIRIFKEVGINHEMYNVSELLLKYFWPTLLWVTKYMQELLCKFILRICQYRIKSFMEVGINHEMYNASNLCWVTFSQIAVSDIIYADAGVVLPIHFKNLSVQNHDFYGGRYNHEKYSVTKLMLQYILADHAVSNIINADAGAVLLIHFKNLSVQNQDC